MWLISMPVKKFNCQTSPTALSIHKLQKIVSKFYRRHYELVSKFNVGLKPLLHQGLSEPGFYGDLVYKLKKMNIGLIFLISNISVYRTL